MSILNFPRIYFNGRMFWNPPTANNNDALPLYDAVKVDMNWPFLSSFGITPHNVATDLLPWMIQPLAAEAVPEYVMAVPGVAQAGFPFIPAEWDMFGDNACGAVDYLQTKSVVVGGELLANQYIKTDSLVNKNYQILGNQFGGKQTAARLVDISPWQNTFTALYFDQFVLGDATSGLVMNRKYRMLDRFLNFNWGAISGLNTVTTTWQTCFPKDHLVWNCGDSVLLQQLKSQMESQNAKGLMLRFSTYLTFYDKNGIFNDYPVVNSKNGAQMQAMYQKALDNVAEIFFNPAYSSTAGTVGLWFDNEFPTAPGGPRLIAGSTAPTVPTTPNPVQLGVLVAALNQTAQNPNVLSLDVSNTFPFYPIDKNAAIPLAAKFNLGEFDLGVGDASGQFNKIASLTYSNYCQQAFDMRSGLIDIPLTAQQAALLNQGPLQLQPANSTATPLLQQREWTAEVVESGSFISVGEEITLNIMVQKNGQPAPAGVHFCVAQYGNPFMLSTSNYYLCFENNADFVLYQNFPNKTQNTAELPQFLAPVVATQNQQPALSVQFSGNNNTHPSSTQRSGRQIIPSSKTTSLEVTSVPVMYSQVLASPVGISLTPCVQLQGETQVSGQISSGTVVYQTLNVVTDANGIATIKLRGISPGFPTLRFFMADEPVAFSFSINDAYIDFLAPLRVLPAEPQLMGEFIAFWNGCYQDAAAGEKIWHGFVYPRILEPFYYLYPIMNKYMPLNDLSRIEGAVDQLIVLVSKEYEQESALAMPITRDLPQDRRAVLELWAKALVKRNYPPMPLPSP